MNTKTKNMVGVALFIAIVVVLQMLGGGIKVGGMFSISLVLIPIVVGAALYGWKAGGILGVAFGVAVLASGDAAAFWPSTPLPLWQWYCSRALLAAFAPACSTSCWERNSGHWVWSALQLSVRSSTPVFSSSVAGCSSMRP